MKTLNELAAELTRHVIPNGLCNEAAAMLRTQAQEIERLTGCLEKANIQAEKFEREWYLRGDENEALKVAYVKELDKVSERNYSLRKENEALKADAERYKWLKTRLLCADFAYGDQSEACSALVFEIPDDMRVSANLDLSIDAMRKS